MWMSGYFLLNALTYCCATWTLGVHPHQVRFAEVAEPLLPPGELPPAQAVRSKTRKPSTEIAGITRRRRPAFADLRMVPPRTALNNLCAPDQRFCRRCVRLPEMICSCKGSRRPIVICGTPAM